MFQREDGMVAGETNTDMRKQRGEARRRLLDASLGVIRERGFEATSIDDLCRAAGVTKGAFFHHFESKEALGVAAAAHWSQVTGTMFAAAPYHDEPTALGRVLAYVRMRRAMISGEPGQFTCLAGTMVQEVHDSSPLIRDACRAAIFDHAETLETDFTDALQDAGVGGVSPRSLALHTQAVLQGAFILAKADGKPETAAEQVDHLLRYLELLFASGAKRHGAETQT
jgi:TetR/AcrR family transcriptional repressor of nem operon